VAAFALCSGENVTSCPSAVARHDGSPKFAMNVVYAK